MIVSIFASILMAYADRFFGQEKKFRGQVLGTLAIAFVAMYHAWNTYGIDWLFIPILLASIVSFLSLRQWGIWGELFPNVNKDKIDKHLWFVKLVNRTTGMQYSMREGSDLIRWKRIAWGFRYAIYGLPMAVLFAVCSLSITPVLLLPIAGLIRGVIYDYGFSEIRGLSWCEFWGGGIAFLIISIGA